MSQKAAYLKVQILKSPKHPQGRAQYRVTDRDEQRCRSRSKPTNIQHDLYSHGLPGANLWLAARASMAWWSQASIATFDLQIIPRLFQRIESRLSSASLRDQL